MDSISELLARRARDDAAKPFCLFDGVGISFADLDDRVNRLANGFAALGLEPGDRVAVMLANHPDHPVVFLALVRLGVTQVPINIHLRGLGLECVLAHPEARAVVADERFLRSAGGIERVRAPTSITRPSTSWRMITREASQASRCDVPAGTRMPPSSTD